MVTTHPIACSTKRSEKEIQIVSSAKNLDKIFLSFGLWSLITHIFANGIKIQQSSKKKVYLKPNSRLFVFYPFLRAMQLLFLL